MWPRLTLTLTRWIYSCESIECHSASQSLTRRHRLHGYSSVHIRDTLALKSTLQLHVHVSSQLSVHVSVSMWASMMSGMSLAVCMKCAVIGGWLMSGVGGGEWTFLFIINFCCPFTHLALTNSNYSHFYTHIYISLATIKLNHNAHIHTQSFARDFISVFPRAYAHVYISTRNLWTRV